MAARTMGRVGWEETEEPMPTGEDGKAGEAGEAKSQRAL